MRTIRAASRSTTSTTRGSLSQRVANSIANGDGSMASSSTTCALGLRHDLRGDHDDVAVAKRGPLTDQHGKIVTDADLGHALDGEDLQRGQGGTVTGARMAAMAASAANGVSETFDPSAWDTVAGFEFTDITYHRARAHGTVRIAFDRPDVRNAFRPHTVDELFTALDHARMSPDVGCVLLTGNGPVAGATAGGRSAPAATSASAGGRLQVRQRRDGRHVDPARSGRLHILECQRLIRFMPKVVICVVPGWAAGGGHSLHVVCDLTLASAEHARFKQTDADVASFDGGFGSAYLARQVGQKRAREIFFLGREYSADDYFRMGAVNAVVPHAELEATALEWAAEMNAKSPTAQRMLKYAFNLIDDGLVGQQLFAGEATRLAYGTDEAAEGRDAFLEKRDPDWSPFPYHY